MTRLFIDTSHMRTRLNVEHVTVNGPGEVITNMFNRNAHHPRSSLDVNTDICSRGAGASTTMAVLSPRTYVHRVTSNNGGHTNYDVATTMTFTAPIACEFHSQADNVPSRLLLLHTVTNVTTAAERDPGRAEEGARDRVCGRASSDAGERGSDPLPRLKMERLRAAARVESLSCTRS